MIKKYLLVTVILSAALAVTMASSALAAFGNLELVRVVLQQTGGTTEIATDLGTVSSVLAGGTFGGGSDAFTAQAGGTDFAAGSAGLHAVYFAVNQTTRELWITGLDPSISAGKSTTITGLTTNIFSYYNINLGGGPTVLANASAQNSYRVRADGTTQFGQFGSAIVLAARPFTEANLAPLATGGSVTQTLYYFSNYATASAGVAVATITTHADGSTTKGPPPPPVDGACGAAHGVSVVSPPTDGLCTSGSASSVAGSGPWNWTCNGQNGGAQAACSAPVLQTTTTPTITWATPAAITYGTALSATQLNATASDPVTSADVPGTFAYTPAPGSILNAGTQSLSVIFTPSDTVNYTTTTATVNLIVNQTTPTITWATPAAITYGTILSATQLNATASVPGTFAYSPTPGSLLNAGTQSLSVIFTPTDSVNHTTATATVNLVVNKATPTITWATPAAISYGTALSATQLNATASVPGAFTYSPALGTILSNGNQILTVTFTPADIANYTTANTSVGLTVDPTVRVMGDKGYDSLLAVTQAISKDSTIQARDIYTAALPETLIFNNGFNVTLNGGYNAGFAAVTGVTTIKGKLTIMSGKLIVSGVAIKP